MWHGRVDELWNMKKFAAALGLHTKQTHSFVASNKVEGLAATLDGLCTLDSSTANSPDWERPLFERAMEEYLGTHVAPEFEVELLSKDADSWVPSLMEDVQLASGVGLIEMKQTEAWWGKEWAKATPDHYWLQVQAQLLVTGLPWAILACQIGAAMFRAVYIEPCEDTHKEIEVAVADFWEGLK